MLAGPVMLVVRGKVRGTRERTVHNTRLVVAPDQLYVCKDWDAWQRPLTRSAKQVMIAPQRADRETTALQIKQPILPRSASSGHGYMYSGLQPLPSMPVCTHRMLIGSQDQMSFLHDSLLSALALRPP